MNTLKGTKHEQCPCRHVRPANYARRVWGDFGLFQMKGLRSADPHELRKALREIDLAALTQCGRCGPKGPNSFFLMGEF